MKQIIKFSKEEIGALETIASIECDGITCCNCPLNIVNIPYSFAERGCYRTMAHDILRANEQKGGFFNEDKNT